MLSHRESIPLFSLFSSTTSDHDLPYHRAKRRRPLPRLRIVGYFALIGAVLFLLFWKSTKHRPISHVSDWVFLPSMLSTAASYPLTFHDIREYERQLPQHDTSLPSPEGVGGRAIKFSNEVWGLGLNNQLNNRLVLSHLSYLSNRSYVFQDIMFNDTWDDATWFPLNTFISGPTAGGPFPPSAGSAPRAISKEYWFKICPEKKRVLLDVETINRELELPSDPDGDYVLKRWAEKLKNMTDPCIEITPASNHIIDYHFFGSPRSLSLFPSFSTSPVVSHFRWSDVVLHTVARNIPLITHTRSAIANAVTRFSPPGTINKNRPATVPTAAISSLSVQKDDALSQVLALHVRRGDYEPHCRQMSEFASGYNSWNLLPSLPDVYDSPNGHRQGKEFDEFMRHCWPSIPDIVQRVREVKRDYEAQRRGTLRSIYVLTNGKRPYIDELTRALLSAGMGWERVTSSRDLVYVSPAEKLANQAADMEIARRAALFVGNGFSTMTANIILFRLVNGMSAQTARFW